MTLTDAISLIEKTIKDNTQAGDSSFRLDFTSQLEEIDDAFIPKYRADILYLHCGFFESSISEALISLALELHRAGFKL